MSDFFSDLMKSVSGETSVDPVTGAVVQPVSLLSRIIGQPTVNTVSTISDSTKWFIGALVVAVIYFFAIKKRR